MRGYQNIKEQEGFVLLFVLLALLLTGISAASLLNNSVLSNKIVNNYIIKKKTEMAAHRGLFIIEKIKKDSINLDYPLDLWFGSDYNIRINMEKSNKYEEKEINFEIIAKYRNNKKVLYHSYKE